MKVGRKPRTSLSGRMNTSGEQWSILQGVAAALVSALCGFTCESLWLLRTLRPQPLLILHLLLTASAVEPHSTPAVETRDNSVPSLRCTWQCLETQLVVPLGGCYRQIAGRRQDSGCTPFRAQGSPTTERVRLQGSVPRWRTPTVGILFRCLSITLQVSNIPFHLKM